MIANVPGRATRSLNGKWRTIVDPYEAGYYSFHGEAWQLGWFRNFDVRPGLAEYDFDKADLLDVPGDWNSQSDRLFFYEGTVWYKTEFDAPPVAGVRRFLHFAAANYDAKVWLNGEKLGEHAGGFTPFAFEVTDRARAAGNVLIVKVDNQRKTNAVPAINTDWWNYGGLTRDVSLVDVPETFVREYGVELEPGDGSWIRAWAQLDGPGAQAGAEVILRIAELGLEASAVADASGRVDFRLEAPSLERWSPEQPRRYELEIEALDDSVRDWIGFRTIATRGQDILLNGEPLFLRGISIHEEAPTRPGRAYSEDDARILLGWAKELGCNFVRLAHYTHNEPMVRVADELGLLVWAEIPVYWGIEFENPDTLAVAKQQLGEMIARDRNRACIILWSVANETPQSDARLRFLIELVRLTRELDPARLVSAALMARMDEGTMRLDDPLAEHLDVMGCNEYLGWYYAKPEEVPAVRWESPYDKPLVMSEFGAGALAGNTGDRGTPFTEEYQAWVYESQIEMFRKIPFLRGLSPWILKDFRSPRRVLKDIQDYWNRKGLVSDRGERKQAFAVLQRYYGELERADDAHPPIVT